MTTLAGADPDLGNTRRQVGRPSGPAKFWSAKTGCIWELKCLSSAGADTYDSGNGGGGSGGAIYLLAGTVQGSGAIAATGGLGLPSQNSWNSGGDDGGVGRIRIDFHTAGTEPFGSTAAHSFIDNLTAPDAGATAIYLQ